MSALAVQMEHICFAYEGGNVLDEVNLTIRVGDAVCIIGPNGGGKTTLLKLMLGLLKPTAGTVRIFGQSPTEAVKKIGYMPQSLLFDPLFPVTVREVVLMGRLKPGLWSRHTKEDLEIAHRSLERMLLVDLADRRFSSLSGGQRQRVLIARALACEPQLLLLDEPTANIDWTIEHQLLEALNKLKDHLTVVIVSHDLGFVSSLVNKVLCVNRQVAEHPTHAMCDPLLEKLYGYPLQHVHHTNCC